MSWNPMVPRSITMGANLPVASTVRLPIQRMEQPFVPRFHQIADAQRLNRDIPALGADPCARHETGNRGDGDKGRVRDAIPTSGRRRIGKGEILWRRRGGIAGRGLDQQRPVGLKRDLEPVAERHRVTDADGLPVDVGHHHRIRRLIIGDHIDRDVPVARERGGIVDGKHPPLNRIRGNQNGGIIAAVPNIGDTKADGVHLIWIDRHHHRKRDRIAIHFGIGAVVGIADVKRFVG